MDRLPQKLIYVIDDDEDDFQILRDTILTKWPTVALEHFPDPEVFLITREFRKCPDLVVLDINMPKINGFEVIKALKNDESWTQVPVIFLSTSITLKDKALELGAQDCLVKPSSVEQWAEIAETIKNTAAIWFGNRRAFG